MTDKLEDWIGRTEERTDVPAASAFAGLAATLDHVEPPWRAGEMPPLGHWLCFLPTAPQREIGPDGHPRRGGFLPPVPLPRRMWAGSRVTFQASARLGEPLRRLSTIADVKQKTGQTGTLVFVTLRHEISNAAGPVATELQDLVYREASTPGATAPAPLAPPADANSDWSRVVTPDPVLLFRFSALTFNAHRIHYDRLYAETVEGYAGLVVHGPLTATLLMDLFLRRHPGARVTTFSFRGRRPLIDTRPFTLSATARPNGAALAAIDADGQIAMSADLEAV